MGLTEPDDSADHGLQWLSEVIPGRDLIVACGGIRSGVGLPPFEFRRMLSEYDANALMLRDLDQCWYQRGVRGVGASPRAVAEFIDETIADIGATRTIMIGNSAGGFGAMLIGSMVTSPTEVVAVSPQTFVGRWLRARHRDFRWPVEIFRMRRSALPDPVLDLAAIAEKIPPTWLYFSEDLRLDREHARRLGGAPNVHFEPRRDGHGHRLVSALRDSGELDRILRRHLAGSNDVE